MIKEPTWFYVQLPASAAVKGVGIAELSKAPRGLPVVLDGKNIGQTPMQFVGTPGQKWSVKVGGKTVIMRIGAATAR